MRLHVMNRSIATLATVAGITGLCLVPVAAQAQSPASPSQTARPTTTTFGSPTWTVTPFAGVGFSGDLDSGAGAIGVAAGYNWRPQVSLEAELSSLPSSEAGGLVEVNSSMWSLTGNLLYHFNKRPWVPYGAIGLGFGHGSVDVNSNDAFINQLDTSDTEFVFNFGGGFERRFARRTAFRGDLRYFFGGDLVPDYWRLGAGLTFGLGGRP
jgi:opacity protein-like surface antigen